jgi:alpha/beta superfamily hydrolase
MNVNTLRISIPGAAGAIEVAIDRPQDAAARGLAVIAHPHPLFGGTLDNKVVQTLARAFVALGYVAARPNFRGVGASAGVHDEGRGEADDLVVVAQALQREHGLSELVLAGFSFGGVVQTHVAGRLRDAGTPASRIVLVAPGVTRGVSLPVPSDTLVIHGETDETVPLSAVIDWARPQQLPIVVIPGADHFFHHRLTLIKDLVIAAWLGERAGRSAQAQSPHLRNR